MAFPCSAASFHHFTAVLSSWGTPCPLSYIKPRLYWASASPVRQQVCTTSPQSYSPGEHLVLCVHHTQIVLGIGIPLFARGVHSRRAVAKSPLWYAARPFWKSWLQDTPALPRSRATARQMVAVRFLIRKVWQKAGMEQIPLWERYGHRCMNNRTIGQTL